VHHRGLEPFFVDAQRLALIGSWTAEKRFLTPSSAVVMEAGQREVAGPADRYRDAV